MLWKWLYKQVLWKWLYKQVLWTESGYVPRLNQPGSAMVEMAQSVICVGNGSTSWWEVGTDLQLCINSLQAEFEDWMIQKDLRWDKTETETIQIIYKLDIFWITLEADVSVTSVCFIL